jgi:lipid-A-disaccharide synthase
MPTAPQAVHLAMVAGEASGDLLGSMLLASLQAAVPGLRAYGIGGPRLTACGFDAWWPSDRLAVRGYAEVLRHYRSITRIRRDLARRLTTPADGRPPRLFVGIDAPDFNLGLEDTLKSRGIRTAHFVSPSIWAWRGERVKRIIRSTDLMLCVFPFEPALYAGSGVQAHFVGHPLADQIDLDIDPVAARVRLASVLGTRADAVTTWVAVLPGSRASEIRYLMPTFADTLRELLRRRPDWGFVVPAAPGMRPLIEASLRGMDRTRVWVCDGHSHQVLAGSDLVLVASGTATLEAMLFKKPMVIAYRMAWLSWQLMNRMRYQPWVGLPNILAGRFCVPEFLQEAATPQALADALEAWTEDPQRVVAVRQEFRQQHLNLRHDMAKAATGVLAPLLVA